jgi:hypothetical protein
LSFDGRRLGGNVTTSLGQEVEFVVPVVLEDPGNGSIELDDTGGAGRGGGETLDLVGCEVAELAVQRNQRLLGRRVLGGRAEQVGHSCESGPHCGANDWCTDRAPPRPGKGGGAQEVGKPVHRQQRDTGDATTGG